MIPGLSQVPSNHNAAVTDLQDPAQRAAALRARLLSMKSNSGTPKKEVTPGPELPSVSAVDVENLIAEGRAAVEAQTTITPSINGVRQDNIPMTDTTAGGEQRKELSHNPRHTGDAEDSKHNGADKASANLHGNHQKSNSELQLYDDSNDRNNVRPGIAAAYSHYFDDLDEWLEITGYHDRPFRDKYLQKQRLLADLERQRIAIESDLETETMPAALRARARQNTTISQTPTRVVRAILPPQAPTEPLVIGTPNTTKAQNKRPVSEDATDLQPTTKFQRTTAPAPAPPSVIAQINRDRPAPARIDRDMPPPAKPQDIRQRARSLEPGSSRPYAHNSHTTSPSWKSNRDNQFPIPNRSFDNRGRTSAVPDERHRVSYHDRTYDERRLSSSDRFDRRGAQTVAPRPPAPLQPARRGTRYFMIKSWNHENVEISQREGTWATQLQNEELFRDAFNTARNVMLVFSVNKSMAFQGYVSATIVFLAILLSTS